MCLVYDGELENGGKRQRFGICLPDGRFVLLSADDGVATFSNEERLLRYNPGARLLWTPQIDATINHVEGADEDAA